MMIKVVALLNDRLHSDDARTKTRTMSGLVLVWEQLGVARSAM
jgi:hypothetical protein